MTTIQIAYDVSDSAITKIESHLDRISATNPNWSGAKFEIERDDFTCVPGDDSYDAVALLQDIFWIIEQDEHEDKLGKKIRKITVSGGFHNVDSIQINPTLIDGRISLSMGQVKRLEKHMCGIKGCTCSSGLLGWEIEGATKDQLMHAITDAQAEAWAGR